MIRALLRDLVDEVSEHCEAGFLSTPVRDRLIGRVLDRWPWRRRLAAWWREINAPADENISEQI